MQRKEIATKRRETPLCCKQKTDIITESKTNNRKEKQSQATKQWLQPAFHIDGSKSREKQELESLNINIPCYSGEKYLRKRKLQSVSDSLSIANQEMNGINELDTSMCAKDLSKEVKMNAENAAVSALELHDEIPIKSFTAVVASNETALHILANKTDGSKTEFHKPIFCAETPVVNSMRKISGGQLMDTSLRNRSSAADDCKYFSSE